MSIVLSFFLHLLNKNQQFELVYSAALFPPASTPVEVARRFRQNFLSNAREVIRITGGKSVIFSSGPGGSENGLRGCLDVVNLLVFRFFAFFLCMIADTGRAFLVAL